MLRSARRSVLVQTGPHTHHDTFRHGVGAPVVGEIEGDYHYDHKRSVLEWQLPVIDESNKSGVLEFSISGHPDDFFPINVSFGSTKSFCDLKVTVLIFKHTITTYARYLLCNLLMLAI